MADLSHRRILKIAVPIVLANVTVPLLGLVDTGVVGQLGAAEPIGAVAIGAMILTSIYWVFGFLRMGTTGLTSQAIGAGHTGEVSALLFRGLLLGGGFGAVIILLQMPIFALSLYLSPGSIGVEALAHDYMSVRVWSAPAAIALYAVNGWLIAAERTRAVLLLQIVMNGANILLDVLFVLGLGWGVAGVAGATFIAEWLGLALGLWLCRDALRTKVGWPAILDPARLKNMAAVNTDILIRSLGLLAVFVLFIFWGAGFGDVPLAANQVLLQFTSVTAFALDGFAFAAETLVGKAFGRRDPTELRQAALRSSAWGLGASVLMAAGFWLGGGTIIDILTTAPDVREEARIYLPYMAVAPILGLPAFMFDGIFIGATRSRDMRNMSILSLGFYLVAALALMPAFGNHGLWMAMIVSYCARGLTLALRYPALERAAR